MHDPIQKWTIHANKDSIPKLIYTTRLDKPYMGYKKFLEWHLLKYNQASFTVTYVTCTESEHSYTDHIDTLTFKSSKLMKRLGKDIFTNPAEAALQCPHMKLIDTYGHKYAIMWGENQHTDIMQTYKASQALIDSNTASVCKDEGSVDWGAVASSHSASLAADNMLSAKSVVGELSFDMEKLEELKNSALFKQLQSKSSLHGIPKDQIMVMSAPSHEKSFMQELLSPKKVDFQLAPPESAALMMGVDWASTPDQSVMLEHKSEQTPKQKWAESDDI